MSKNKMFVLNWRKAISELFLIVVGVSIALAADSWLSDKNEEARTNLLLDSLEEEWATELTRIEEHLNLMNQAKKSIAVMLEARDKNPQDIPDDLINSYADSSNWGTFKPSNGAHSTLMIDGIQNITDPALRHAIVSWASVIAEIGPEHSALAQLGTIDERTISTKVARNSGVGFTQQAIEKNFWTYGMEQNAFYKAALADEEYVAMQLRVLNLLYAYEEELAVIKQTLEQNLVLLRKRNR